MMANNVVYAGFVSDGAMYPSIQKYFLKVVAFWVKMKATVICRIKRKKLKKKN